MEHSTGDSHLWQCRARESDSVSSQLPLVIHLGPLMEFQCYSGLYWEVASITADSLHETVTSYTWTLDACLGSVQRAHVGTISMSQKVRCTSQPLVFP